MNILGGILWCLGAWLAIGFAVLLAHADLLLVTGPVAISTGATSPWR